MCQSLDYDMFHTDARGQLLIEPPFLSALSTCLQITFGKRIICTSQVGKRNIVKLYDLPMTAPEVSGKTWKLNSDHLSSA